MLKVLSRTLRVHALTGRLTLDALHNACKAVKRNRGAAGLDTQSIKVFEANVEENLLALMRARKSGTYQPIPLRRVYIPKGHGAVRPLGMPMLCAYCTSLLRRVGISVMQTMGLHEIDQAHPVERSSSPWATHDLASPCGSPLASRAFLSPPGALIVSPAWSAGPAAVSGPS